MIDSMYKVFDRINELSERFGLKRHNHVQSTDAVNVPSNAQNPGSAGFERILQSQIGSEPGDIGHITPNPDTFQNQVQSPGEINNIPPGLSPRGGLPSVLTRAVSDTEAGFNPESFTRQGAMNFFNFPETRSYIEKVLEKAGAHNK